MLKINNSITCQTICGSYAIYSTDLETRREAVTRKQVLNLIGCKKNFKH